jgi:hypothetical protein
MPTDWTYGNRDRALLASGRYEFTSGCWPKVLREMSSAYCQVDGAPYGNRALLQVDRGSLLESDLEALRRGYEEVGLRYQRPGLIRDLEVLAELGPEPTAAAIMVGFFDGARDHAHMAGGVDAAEHPDQGRREVRPEVCLARPPPGRRP